MKAILLPTLLVIAALAGCTSAAEGTFTLDMTDAPGSIADFAFLNVTVSKIQLKGIAAAGDNETADEDNKTSSKTTYSPASATFDMTKLLDGNTTTIFSEKVPAGEYKKLTLYISEAKGTLVETGEVIDIKAPSGRVFLNQKITIEEGTETMFLFDIQVHQTGNGEYQLKPNASGSKATTKA